MYIVPVKADHIVRRTPWATVMLIAVNTAIYFPILLAGSAREQIFYQFGLIPARHQLLTLVSHMFLHVSPIHILGNMAFLWVYGADVEDTLGRAHFLLAYLAAGLCAAALHVAVDIDSATPCIGASGAISGVLGLYVALFPRVKMDLALVVLFWDVKRFKTDALRAAGAWLAFQVALGLLTLVGLFPLAIAFWAHAGGFLGGLALGWLWVRYDRRPVRATEMPRLIRALDAWSARAAASPKSTLALRAAGLGLLGLFFATLAFTFQEHRAPALDLGRIFPRTYTLPGTPPSLPAEAISPENAFDVVLLARWPVTVSVESLAFSPGGEWLAVRLASGAVEVWQVDAGARRYILDADGDSVFSLAFSPDGELLALATFGLTSKLLVYRMADCSLASGVAVNLPAYYVAFQPDRTLLSVDPFGHVEIRKLPDLRLAQSFFAEATFARVTASPDGKWLAALVGDSVRKIALWDVEHAQVVRELDVEGLPSSSGTWHFLAFSPDSSLLAATGHLGRVHLWRVENGEPVGTLHRGQDTPSNLTFSPDGRVLALAAQHSVWLCRVADVSTLRPLAGTRLGDWTAFSPDGRLLATAGADGVVRLWGVR